MLLPSPQVGDWGVLGYQKEKFHIYYIYTDLQNKLAHWSATVETRGCVCHMV